MNEQLIEYYKDIATGFERDDPDFYLDDVKYDEIEEKYVFSYKLYPNYTITNNGDVVLQLLIKNKLENKLYRYGIRIPHSVTLEIIRK